MKVLNMGSMNLDFVYQLDHIVQPGETESSQEMNVFLGGKGMNQSVALAKAGATVYHGGMIGEDGQPFLDACAKYGIHADYICQVAGKSGHAIIQIDQHAQNCILLYGGTNQMLTKAYVDEVLTHFDAGDLLLLQNEVNLIPYLVDRADEKGMQIALNPSPFDQRLQSVDMRKIHLFLLNEVEGEQITGQTQPDAIVTHLLQQVPHAKIVLTLGKSGAIYADEGQQYFQPVFQTTAVDTTAAGDTFTGYFLTGMIEELPIPQVLRMSAMASALAVSRKGAVPAIPDRAEVEAALQQAEKEELQ